MTSTKYRPDIDGLRAIAVLAVVLNHVAPGRITGGYVGVDVFFVISGYLITTILRSEVTERRFTWGGFYQRRIKRLYPALLVVLATVLVASHALLLPSEGRTTARAAVATLAFSSNISFWSELSAGYFAADAKLNPLLHTWSLAVEEQFYLLYPLLLVACLRVAPRRTAHALAWLALGSFAAAVVLVHMEPTAAFFLLPFRAWELLIGGMLAFEVVPTIRTTRARDLTSFVGLAGIALPIVWYREDTTFPGVAALSPVLGAAMLIHGGTGGAGFVQRLLAWRPMVYVGLTSYSLYLWHWPLIVFVRFAAGMESLGMYALALVPASLALGSLSYHFIEQRFRRASTSPRATFAAALACSGAIAAWCAIALVNRGFPERFTPSARVYDDARNPAVPYVECDGRIGDEATPWCRLGAPTAPASVLLWGDSHMLAWAPAIHEILRSHEVQAVFVPNSGCPPFLGVDVETDPSCREANESVRAYLTRTPEITTVIMAAYWRAHVTSTTAASFSSTLEWLTARPVQVALIAPTPVYDKDVPLALALGEASATEHGLQTSLTRERLSNAAFWAVADRAAHPRLHIIDPVPWLCDPGCEVQLNGEPLFRDRHHLSRAGARRLEPQLGAALASVLAP